ncbi:MAG: methyl-accepting chemotaxis protein [Ideonella sp.]
MSSSDPTDARPGVNSAAPALRGTRLDITAGDTETHEPTTPGPIDPIKRPQGRRLKPARVTADASSGLAKAYDDASIDVDEEADAQTVRGEASRLPLIGGWSAAMQQRLLTALVVLGAVGLVGLLILDAVQWQRSPSAAAVSAQAQLHTQRLAKAASQSTDGNTAALDQLQGSAKSLDRAMDGLIAAFAAHGETESPVLKAALSRTQAMQANVATLLAQRASLVQSADLMLAIERQAMVLQEGVEGVSALKLQQGAAAAELAAVGQLMMLSQRIPYGVSRLLTAKGVNRDRLVTLGKDLSVFRALLEALITGSAELRLSAPRDRLQQERLAALLKQFELLQDPASSLLNKLQALSAARVAQSAILADSEALGPQLETIAGQLAGGSDRVWPLYAMAACAVLLLLGGLGWLRLFVVRQHQRAALADSQRIVAQRLQSEARRSNDANQTAILRLMNELQAVAEGDLTQQATVTEDITGAIADSVNYTVEELRSLVAQVQGTAARVTDTTGQVETTSVELLAASAEQLREIRDTGEAVLQMAGRIVQVSAQAQLMSHVAQQSRAAGDRGSTSVQATIGGMHVIRDQIQDTSKRIKRLGESSQEIGEITELISDITEQTNVLALNAAIQAASAGEAGRGFSVVAEEVQRLAERSADATRQIAALVRTIQVDTQDAVAAMERSTQGVVEGTRLSDAAGAALSDIDGVSRRLSELIEGISTQALQEADTANVVATNIQHILAVTEQTGEGTRSTARMVRELSQTADELRQSVARFKIV